MIITIAEEDEYFIPLRYMDINPDYYTISNYGTIINKKGKVLRPYTDHDGYLRLELATIRKNVGRKAYVHRLVGFQFVDGYSKKKNHVNHLDSVRSNNYYKNLEWTTSKGNTDHGIEHGFKGDNEAFIYSQRKYDEELVHEICRHLQDGRTTKQILKLLKYPIEKRRTYKTLIVDIRSKRSWRLISDLYKW